MSEIADVVAGEPIEADWGNLVRSRSIQRYDTPSDPDLPAIPVDGDPAYFVDENRLSLWDGSDWRRVVDTAGDQTIGGFFRMGGSNAGDVYLRPGGGTEANPPIAFWGDPTTGIFRVSSGVLGLAAFGNKTAQIHSNGIRAIDGVNNNPAYSFISAPGGGIRYSGGVLIDANGVGVGLYVRESQRIAIHTNFAPTTGNAANGNWGLTGSYYQFARETSSKRYKREIRKLVTTKRRDALDVRLNPVSFIHKDDEDNDQIPNAGYLGFIAEEVAEIDDRLAVYDDEGLVENYDLRGVVAILAAQVNDLRDQLDRVISNGPGGA